MAEAKWVTLQKKIFGRWIKNKLKPEGVKFDDVLKDMNGYSLATLCATLAEVDKISKKKCPKDKKCKMRVAKIDSAVNALKFMYKLGVKQKIKTSAENIVDGEEKPILGMVWAIMTKFMVIGDESAGQDLKTSLLQWVQNTVKGHKVKVKNFGKHFHDGRVLAAIIHKHRPALIDFESLSPETPEENLEKVFDAAEKYFGLEKYLTPQDIFELREKSMIVYVSEFYYGIAAQRTLDLAAKRIHKLINYTKINDQLKNEYNEKAAALKDRILKVEKVLHDREVDNTLQGAKDKLAAFYKFQKEDKAALIGTLLDIERLYGSIALRLSDHGRPPFVPKEGLGLDGLRDTVKVLEKAEKERNEALHAELNRQLTLLRLQKFHKTLSDVNKKWQAAKKEYLDATPELKISSQAQFEKNTCEGVLSEVVTVKNENYPNIVKLGDKMEAQHFEKMDEVRSLEKELADGISTLESRASERVTVLDDTVKRLTEKERVELQVDQHKDAYDKLEATFKDLNAYFTKKEVSENFAQANFQLALWDNFNRELGNTEDSQEGIKSLAQEILAAEYKSNLSQWRVSADQEAGVNEKVAYVADTYSKLKDASVAKKETLEADLVREQTNLKIDQHKSAFATLTSSFDEFEAYFTKEEVYDTVSAANYQLAVWVNFDRELKNTEDSQADIKNLAKEILAAEYVSNTISWKLEGDGADAVNNRVSTTASRYDTLVKASATKKQTLDAGLVREQTREKASVAYGNKAKYFSQFVARTIQDVETSDFGMTLQDVQEFGKNLGTKDEATRASLKDQLAALHKVYEEGQTVNFVANAYTDETPDNLDKYNVAVEEALTKRRNEYDAELAKQIKHDNLCKTFADAAEPFAAKITSKKDEITNLQTELKEQLATMQEEQKVDYSGELSTIADADAAVKNEGISHNPHTLLKNDQMVALHEDLVSFLKNKAQMIAEEIQHKELRGLTPEQHADIEKQFKQFDKDGSGKLSTAEFKVVLYSLGFERSKKEIQELANQFGDGNEIPYEGFREFMIKELGDNESEEEINKGFGLLANFEDELSPEKESFFSPEDWKWFTNTCPKKGDGFQYKKWVKEMYSR